MDDFGQPPIDLRSLERDELMNLVKAEAFDSAPPGTREALAADPELWYDTIVTLLTDINNQLAQRNNLARRNSAFPSSAEFQAWRGKAIAVKSRLDIRVRDAKEARTKARVASVKSEWNHKFKVLYAAVLAHREAMEREAYEPSEFDTTLWDVLTDIQSGVHDRP